MNPVLDQSMRSQAGAIPRRVHATHAEGKGPIVLLRPATDSRSASQFATRVLNVLIAGTALIALSWLFALVAVLIKLTSKGPIFYTQTRVGIDRRGPWPNAGDSRRKVDFGGKLFRIYKFRTMSASTSSAVQIWAEPNDKRITWIGRYLRKYRVDELPQLVNVLRGEMNVVGPRPEQPNIFVDLRGQISGYSNRQQVLPGITGWAQINHHYDSCVDDVKTKLAYDLEYIERQAPLTDLVILLKTVPVVLLRRGGW